ETVKDMYYEAAAPLDKDSEVIINYLVANFGKPGDAAPTSAASAATRPALGERTNSQNDLRAVVERSMKRMGVEQVRTMVISGEGASSAVGQSFNPHSRWWRRFATRNYVRSIDFEKKAWRIQSILGEGETPPGGGAGRITPAPDVAQNPLVVEDVSFSN